MKVLLIKAARVLTESGLRESGPHPESEHVTPGRSTLSVSSLTELINSKIQRQKKKKKVAKLETKKRKFSPRKSKASASSHGKSSWH